MKTSSVSSQRKLVYGNTNHLKLDSIGEKENSVLGKLPELTNGHRGLVAVVFIKVACLFGSAKAKASLIRKKILGYLALPSPYSGPSHLGHYPSI